MNNSTPTAQSGPSAEETLHAAICNAVILLNNGEEFAPRVSAVLRAALAEYIPTPTPTTPPAGARDAVPFTDASVDTIQARMADLGFVVPVRVISEGLHTALTGKPGAGEGDV